MNKKKAKKVQKTIQVQSKLLLTQGSHCSLSSSPLSPDGGADWLVPSALTKGAVTQIKIKKQATITRFNVISLYLVSLIYVTFICGIMFNV